MRAQCGYITRALIFQKFSRLFLLKSLKIRDMNSTREVNPNTNLVLFGFNHAQHKASREAGKEKRKKKKKAGRYATW